MANEEGVRHAKALLRRYYAGIEGVRKFVNTEDLFNWLYSELRTFTRIFEIYLCICVNGTLDKSSRISLFTDIKPNRLLSFNYTTTYQDVYNASIPKDFIHGKAFLCDNKENCNLVLGFDDHYFDSADTISELIPFEKYYQRIVYRNTNQFFEWVDEKDKNGQPEEKEIYFFGHSLSPADGDVIKLLIECENAKTPGI